MPILQRLYVQWNIHQHVTKLGVYGGGYHMLLKECIHRTV